MTNNQPIWDEEKQKQRLLQISKLVFLFVLIYTLWIALLLIGIYYLELGPKWAVLTADQWVLSAIILISIAILLEIIFVIKYILQKKKYSFAKKQPTFLQGKLVHNYTIPINAKGGIFSKTYVLIDEENILNLRYQMIPPSDLWEQKQ